MAETFEYTREWTDAAAFPLLGFTKNWENPGDYPTVELDETQVRKDMQSLHDEVKDYINNKLIPAVLAEDATEDARKAAELRREENESERKTHEELRVSNETARSEAEAKRKAGEESRVISERARENAEAKRAENERIREANESDRISGEQRRRVNEEYRQNVETGYIAQAKSQAAAAANYAAAAERSRAAITDMSVSAEALPTGLASVQKSQDPDGTYHLHFGLPKGETGSVGLRGPAGPQGVEGPQGVPGPRGINGVAVAASGTYAFNVNEDGHLILNYTGDTAPDFSINEEGHLILNL